MALWCLKVAQCLVPRQMLKSSIKVAPFVLDWQRWNAHKQSSMSHHYWMHVPTQTFLWKKWTANTVDWKGIKTFLLCSSSRTNGCHRSKMVWLHCIHEQRNVSGENCIWSELLANLRNQLLQYYFEHFIKFAAVDVQNAVAGTCS